MSVTVDGVEQHDKAIPLVDDRQEHSVEVSIPAAGSEGTPSGEPVHDAARAS